MKKSKVTALVARKVAEERERAAERERTAVRRVELDRDERYQMLVLPPQDGTGVCVIGEQLRKEAIHVALGPSYMPRVVGSDSFDPNFGRGQVATFTPRQMCQSFGNGQRVVWYEWQFRGLR